MLLSFSSQRITIKDMNSAGYVVTRMMLDVFAAFCLLGKKEIHKIYIDKCGLTHSAGRIFFSTLDFIAQLHMQSAPSNIAFLSLKSS